MQDAGTVLAVLLVTGEPSALKGAHWVRRAPAEKARTARGGTSPRSPPCYGPSGGESRSGAARCDLYWSWPWRQNKPQAGSQSTNRSTQVSMSFEN